MALVLPYYAAGLPARESLYLYEIGQQWPYTTAVSPLVGLLAFWALAMAPFMSFAVASWCAYDLWTTRAASRSRVAVVVALVVSAVTVAWFTTPLASDLMIWMIDRHRAVAIRSSCEGGPAAAGRRPPRGAF